MSAIDAIKLYVAPLYRTIMNKKQASMDLEAWANLEVKYSNKWSKANKDKLYDEWCARHTMLSSLAADLKTMDKDGFAAAIVEDQILDCFMDRQAINAIMDADFKADMAVLEVMQTINKSFAPRIEMAEKSANEASKALAKARHAYMKFLASPSTALCTVESITAESDKLKSVSDAFELARDADTEAQDHLYSLRDEMRRTMDFPYTGKRKQDALTVTGKRSARP